MTEPTRRSPVKRASGSTTSPPPPVQIRIFISYSHADTPACDRLRVHLAALMREGVEVWFDGDMDAGDALDPVIAKELRLAHIFVALISPDYLASRYCWNIEYKRAMNRRARGSLRVVAAVLRPCDWKATSLAHFKVLPKDGRPVTRWRSADEAYLDIAAGIRGVVRTLRREAVAPAVRPPKKTAAPRKVVKKVSGPKAGRPSVAATKPARSKKRAKPRTM